MFYKTEEICSPCAGFHFLLHCTNEAENYRFCLNVKMYKFYLSFSIIVSWFVFGTTGNIYLVEKKHAMANCRVKNNNLHCLVYS